MEIENIKKGIKKVEQLEQIQNKIKELSKVDAISRIELAEHGNYPSSSYSVNIRDDDELLMTIKLLCLDKLKRTEKALIKQIESI